MITVINPYIIKSKVLNFDSGMVDTGEMYGNQQLEQPTFEIEITTILIEDITIDEACDIANSNKITVKLKEAVVPLVNGDADFEGCLNEQLDIDIYDSTIKHNGSDTSVLIHTCFVVYAV